MAVSQLALYFKTVAPQLPGWAGLAFAGVAALLGLTATIMEKLQQIETSTPVQKYQAAQDTKKLVAAAVSTPLAQESLNAQDLEPTIVYGTIADALDSQAQALVPALTFPTFATVAAAGAWYQEWQQWYTAGAIAQAQIDQIYEHYSAEYTRLTTPAPAAPVEPTAPAAPTAPLVTTSAAQELAATQALAIALAQQRDALQGQLTASQQLAISLKQQLDQAKAGQAAPTVILQAPPAPSVTVQNAVDVAPLAASLAQALPLVGVAFAGGLQNIGKNLGHLMNQGRAECFPSTTQRLLQLALPTALAGLSAQQLTSNEGIQQMVEQRLGAILSQLNDTSVFPPDITPAQAPGVAAARLRQAAMFGISAHAWAVMTESNFLLKSIGMPQLAGFLADMAGFSRVAMATMGMWEKYAIAQPMEQLAGQRFRTTIPPTFFTTELYRRHHLAAQEFRQLLAWQGYPDYLINAFQKSNTPVPPIQDLAMMYAKKEVLARPSSDGTPGFEDAMDIIGIPPEWVNVYKRHLWLDPRLSEIVRIGQFFNPALVEATRRPPAEIVAWLQRVGLSQYADRDDWWFAYRAAKGGYAPEDVPIITETAKRATARREQTLFLDAITRLYRDGFIGDEELDTLTREAWEFSDPIQARIRATQLRTEYEVKADLVEISLRAFSRGILTHAETKEELDGIGVPAERAELYLERELLGLIPRRSLSMPGDFVAGAED